MFSEKTGRILAVLIPALVLIFYALFLTHQINLVTADLGRHIKNGEVLFQNAAVLVNNFYSYTNPDFHVINHHWGSGLIFYFLWAIFGFVGVEVFFILISLAALWIFFVLAKEKVGLGLAALASSAAVLLLAERTEIRPEALSYLFAAFFFLLLVRYRDNPDNPKYVKALYCIPLIEILWLNTHIYFILGPVIVGTFFVESLVANRAIAKKLFVILMLTFLATLASPFGIRGIIEVFTIFNNYGYQLVENQSVWFLERVLGHRPGLTLFKIIFALTAVSFLVPLFRKEWRKIEISSILFTLGFGGMAWFASRNIALFGFFTIPVIVSNLKGFFHDLSRVEKRCVEILAASVLAVAILTAISSNVLKYFPYWRSGGIGLEQGNSAAAEFWKREGLRGPIFNNYDIGGYLIFHLYPREKVFVDNRPEAYPAEFFQKTYIPMQENEEAWKAANEKYHFNAIVFSHGDATPWGRQFLNAQVNDKEWAPVFLDNHIVIFLKRNEFNLPLIKKFGITLATGK
ncbi:MAG: hypothetical protein Q7S86_04840 [bacterium]|nr:hypothetical protein [bacterium]